MRRLIAIAILAVCWTSLLGPISSLAQDEQGDGRKVTTKVAPAYPQLARDMGIRGSVRVEVLVAPNGAVKSLEVKGGHPMLAQAAADAVRKWKWVPATHDTKEPVIVKFEP